MPLAPAGVAVAVGVLTALQARVNGELASRVGGGLQAAVVSFGSGFVLLCAGTLAFPGLRRSLGRVAAALREGGLRGGPLRWWQCLGGLGGGWFVAVQSGTVPTIGVALFTVAVVAGQTGNSLLVDRAGLGPAGPSPVTRARLLAAVVAVAAVGVAVSDRLGGSGPGLSVPALLLAASAGVGIAVQQAVNGRVGAAARQPVAAAWVNFAVGTAALGAALVVAELAWGSGWNPLPSGPAWLYAGGAIGVAFIAAAAWVVRLLGVLLFALLSITGQLGGAVVLDLAAPTAGSSASWQLVAGAALTVVAVVLAGRRR